MKRIILIAEEGDLIGEKKLIAQHLNGEFSGDSRHWRMCDGSEWEVLVSGVGALNVIKALQHLPAQTEVLNIGYAGSSNFAVGSAVKISEARLNHPNCRYPEPEIHLDTIPDEWLSQKTISAVNYSGADFVLQSDYKDCTFDMELAYIAAFDFAKVYSLKIISDNLSLHAYREHAAGVE